MSSQQSKAIQHLSYWIFVFVLLTVVFGRSWGNGIMAFYFITMLLPIVLSTSYFFNYSLLPRYFFKRKYFQFSLYTVYTIIVSLYLEAIVLMLAFILLGRLSFNDIGLKSSDTVLLAIVLYFLVIIGTLMVMSHQINQNRSIINDLIDEKNRTKDTFLNIMSERKMIKIPYKDIRYIESLSDRILIHSKNRDQTTSKEKISTLAKELPEDFIRIHRSFIINTAEITSFTSSQVVIGETTLNIGRSYRLRAKEVLS